MNKLIISALAALAIAGCSGVQETTVVESRNLMSPDGNLEMTFTLTSDGTPQYALNYKGEPVILPSGMGFDIRGVLKAQKIDYNADGTISKSDREPVYSLHDGFTLQNAETSSFDETWTPVWGEEDAIRNNYNELAVNLVQTSTDKRLTIRFRLFDDGLGFRYEFPAQSNLNYFVIKEELTEFALTGDHTAWWIPGDYDTQEYNYTQSSLSEIATKPPRP